MARPKAQLQVVAPQQAAKLEEVQAAKSAEVQAPQSAELQLQNRENERAAKTTSAEINKLVEKLNSPQKSTTTSLAKSPVRMTKNSNKPTSGGSTAEEGGSTAEKGGYTLEATTEMAVWRQTPKIRCPVSYWLMIKNGVGPYIVRV